MFTLDYWNEINIACNSGLFAKAPELVKGMMDFKSSNFFLEFLQLSSSLNCVSCVCVISIHFSLGMSMLPVWECSEPNMHYMWNKNGASSRPGHVQE